VDEIWCVSVNDAFVMGAWARDQKTGGKVRMLGDGSADFAKATGLTLDLTGRGHGPAQQPLLHAGQGWQGGQPEYRSARQV
jgi:peroxiredoxin